MYAGLPLCRDWQPSSGTTLYAKDNIFYDCELTHFHLAASIFLTKLEFFQKIRAAINDYILIGNSCDG